jgi:hypothetical protein
VEVLLKAHLPDELNLRIEKAERGAGFSDN